MKRFLMTSLVFVVVLSLAAGVVAAESAVVRGGTVRIAGQWGTITNNFNPFLASGQNAPGTRSALYESLFFVSVLTGDITPVLAVSYEWKDNLTLVMETREGVKWSDGTPFTAHDVAFTFNYMKQHPALDMAGIWTNGMASVTALDNNTVEFKFATPNTPLFQYIAHTLIVPKHVWEGIQDPTAFPILTCGNWPIPSWEVYAPGCYLCAEQRLLDSGQPTLTRWYTRQRALTTVRSSCS